MMDWIKATGELSKPLDAKHISTRQQAGQTLSYVEGWHVIAEANRIFGFDGWQRETVFTACAWTGEVNGKPACTYTAKVRITVGGVVREGTGAGHGVAKNMGDAHESAIKEAETDAMKRALMTFGNPFGLALYDKSHTNVSNGHDPDEYTQGALTIIEHNDFKNRTDAVKWWNAQAEKRREHNLTQGHVDVLLQALNKRFPPPNPLGAG